MRWLIAFVLAVMVAALSYAAGWMSRESLEETQAASISNNDVVAPVQNINVQSSGEIDGGVMDYDNGGADPSF